MAEGREAGGEAKRCRDQLPLEPLPVDRLEPLPVDRKDAHMSCLAASRPALQAYLSSLEQAVADNRSRLLPLQQERRRQFALRLGREVGYGLADYAPDEVRKVLPTLYSRLLVRNCLDSVGVPVDSREWIAAIEEGYHANKNSI